MARRYPSGLIHVALNEEEYAWLQERRKSEARCPRCVGTGLSGQSTTHCLLCGGRGCVSPRHPILPLYEQKKTSEKELAVLWRKIEHAMSWSEDDEIQSGNTG